MSQPKDCYLLILQIILYLLFANPYSMICESKAETDQILQRGVDYIFTLEQNNIRIIEVLNTYLVRN